MKAYWKRAIIFISLPAITATLLLHFTTIFPLLVIALDMDITFQLTVLSIKWQDFDGDSYAKNE